MKTIFALWGVGDLRPADLAARLPEAAAAQANIADAAVETAMLRITTFDAPVQAVVSVWWADRPQTEAAERALGAVAERVAGWHVEEATPIPPPVTAVLERAPGLSNIAFLRKPDDLPQADWLDRWRNRHTAIAIETQATFGYVQNVVTGPATADAPGIAGIVEELFPIEALGDPHAFYGSGGDAAELARRIDRLMASVATFGGDRNLDVVPTSRYRLR
ncbi:EthD domain-containing protein [Nocardia beijingensis]|uniref:EthD domain-containing protein n=1 Tax=Nocardia beijingensis TaxID=95162 RepID=UPI00189566F4|nr:EthD domain-containing protein [Nocardia beijingensis]MBF6468584.1 EthD domain-containing protein [Nocardia beijingensis]